MLIAQITDPHVKRAGHMAYRRVDTGECLARCVAHVNRLEPRPDIVLMTGDLVDMGRPEEYRFLRELMAPLEIPAYVIPGNHDDRAALRAAFPDHAYLPRTGEYLNYTIEDWPVRLIGLDTTIPGRPGGRLCRQRLDWLAARLDEAPERPTLMFLHHPPFLTGIAHMDVQNCEGGEALGALLKQHRQVVRMICGHVHRAVQVDFHGVAASIGPSHSHAVALDLSAEGPPAFMLEPPAYHLHHWRGHDGFVTHLCFVDACPGPYPFFDSGGALID